MEESNEYVKSKQQVMREVEIEILGLILDNKLSYNQADFVFQHALKSLKDAPYSR